uniref:Uncharacterized protein n=2 Tax=Panagrolaimus superbus TaxID=310955 RepID=A0A914YY71_9BILA
MTDDEIEPKVAIHDTSPKHKDDLIQGTTKAEDEIFPTLAEKDKLLAEWLEIAVAVYNNQVTPKNAENTIICVPQLITTLEFFAQTASETPQRNIKNILYHSTSSSLANKKNLLANFLMDWERNIATYAKPGNFCTQRRLLVNHGFTKSYSLDTFTTFNMLGIEVKILFNEGSDIIRWFKNGCKMKQYPETLGNPINLWPKRNDSTALEKHRETNNCKCPIFVAVSHFEFPFKSCAFDNAKLYQISFRPSPSEKIQVLAFRITCTKLMPLRFNQIAPKCRIIELPSVAEHLSMYIIENCDEIAIQNGNELKQYILSMKNAQVDNEIESLYIPSFFGYPKTTLNIAQSFANALKEVDILFQPGSFNDLAFELAEPSITFKPASSIQHYNHFELMKLPEFTK